MLYEKLDGPLKRSLVRAIGMCELEWRDYPLEYLVIDHCNRCGHMRGVLCNWCNVVLERVVHMGHDPMVALWYARIQKLDAIDHIDQLPYNPRSIIYRYKRIFERDGWTEVNDPIYNDPPNEWPPSFDRMYEWIFSGCKCDRLKVVDILQTKSEIIDINAGHIASRMSK